jgi:hypothetical protein
MASKADSQKNTLLTLSGLIPEGTATHAEDDESVPAAFDL